ncbi:MAG: histidine phosphatase family protein [Candidatus Marsarchaeota archaeon]|nr:histidine phosphatase family protein [Candidatus Marsarchaeota archaeon]
MGKKTNAAVRIRSLSVSSSWKKRCGRPDTEIWLIRHGRAGGNKRHLFNGTKRNPLLTELGKKQMRETAKAMARVMKGRPDVILVSPMLRARQSAYPLAKKFKLKPIVVPLLTEQATGTWTGHSAVKICQQHPELFYRYADGRVSHFFKRAPGGESWASVLGRAGRLLNYLKKHHRGERVVLVSHGVLLLACISRLCSKKPPALLDLRLKNAEPVRMRI